jgi:hypothetical protein
VIGSKNYGVRLMGTNHVFRENNLVAGNTGLELDYLANSVIVSNNITNTNRWPLRLFEASGNRIFHNNIINYGWPVKNEEFSANIWDDDYPSGGNFWSNYTGVDEKSGPNQDQPSSDGIGDTPYIIDEGNLDRYPLMKPFKEIVNVAIINFPVCRTAIGQGYTIAIEVAVENQGNSMENVDITVYANTTAVDTKSVMLISQSLTIVTFAWNTTGFAKGKYSISVIAKPVPCETEIADNKLTYGRQVKLVIPGDVNGDGIVNMQDIYTELILRFMSRLGDSNYSANSDINSDNVINYQDIYIAILHFMQTDSDS